MWAHPLFVYRNFEKRKLEKEEIQVILQYLKTCGLDGIEANYSAFDSSEKEWIYRVVQDAKLFVHPAAISMDPREGTSWE